MKKILTLFLLLILMVFQIGASALSGKTVTTLRIHYFRYADDYENWNIWLWPEGMNGKDIYFDKTGNTLSKDDFGVVTTVELFGTDYYNKSRIGIIFKRGAWLEKDINFDRFIDIPLTTADGILNVYFVEGDERVGYSMNDPNGPDKSNKIKRAYFTEEDKIDFLLTTKVTKEQVKLFEDGKELAVNVNINNNKGSITLNKNLDLSKKYLIQIEFASGAKNYEVTFDGIYDSAIFEETYGYEGHDLGAIVSTNETSFRIWAPLSNHVVLNLYDNGTPADLGGSDEKTTYEMLPDEKGTWKLSLPDNLHGKYYTYSVTNGTKTNEVIDPYAKSAGINGIRGMVVDFSLVNPDDFIYGERPNNITNPTDAIIYELHIRDLTSHSSWNGPEAYRGKFLGLTVEGTKYNNVSTGLDHIKELGVTHVQLLPFFDFGVVDESRLNDPTYKKVFNWGYMPLNFNVPEGSYSTDPYDGSKRIAELKQVVNSLTENNIGLIMDVVYNHTGLSQDSNFNLILPGYFHRLTGEGNFSNGSGTGNETASERFMVRKFIIDSLCFWAQEYNLSGFRFDLMGLHDLETMNSIVQALHEINPKILIYGEPWTGGETPLSKSMAAGKENLDQLPKVGAFNDDIRDGIKGSVFTVAEKGFVQGQYNETIRNKIYYGVAGGVEMADIDATKLSAKKFWHSEPVKTINYVSAHDNHTLYDKLKQSTSFAQRVFLDAMQKQANAIVLTSQGIPFLHAGVEFLRSKPLAKGYDGNSYESLDSVNQLRWDLKAQAKNMEVFNFYKEMIALRKAHPAFRLASSTEVQEKLSFLYQDKTNIIAYQITNQDEAGNWITEGETWGKILVIHNSGAFRQLTLPEGEWVLAANSETFGNIKTYQGGKKISILEHETLILYQGYRELPIKKKGCLSSCAAIIPLGIFIVGLCLLRRKFK
ncbi:MAG: type I pullulanase [Acholeplasmataceae bacterium]|nr:type I pullulanase [Acholeplasmataceae bacterium]